MDATGGDHLEFTLTQPSEFAPRSTGCMGQEGDTVLYGAVPRAYLNAVSVPTFDPEPSIQLHLTATAAAYHNGAQTPGMAMPPA